MPSSSRGMSHAWQGVNKPSRCQACSKTFTKSLNEKGWFWFCSNKHCETVGHGFMEIRPGVYIDGYYKDAVDELETFSHAVEARVAQNKGEEKTQTVKYILEVAIKNVEAGKFDAVKSQLEALLILLAAA